jgi:hypothetical protein
MTSGVVGCSTDQEITSRNVIRRFMTSSHQNFIVTAYPESVSWISLPTDYSAKIILNVAFFCMKVF